MAHDLAFGLPASCIVHVGKNFVEARVEKLFVPDDMRSGKSLVVNFLPENISKSDVIALFQPFGPIFSVGTRCDSQHVSRGTAFVNFFNTHSAEQARLVLDNSCFQGRRLKVVHAYYNNIVSKDNCIFVGNMPKEWTLVRVVNYFMHFGPIITAKIITRNNGSSHEHGFVRFFNNSSAKLAIQHLQDKENNPVGLVVNIAGPAYRELKKVKESKKVETKVSQLPAGNPVLLNAEFVVRIDGIGDSHLESLLSHIGALNLTNIVEIPNKSERGKPNVLAKFSTLSDAMLAIRLLNGFTLEGITLSANLI